MDEKSEVVMFPPRREKSRRTTADRMHEAVYKNEIMWSDLIARVRANTGMSADQANDEICALIERKSCSLAVAVAIIDKIMEGRQ